MTDIDPETDHPHKRSLGVRRVFKALSVCKHGLGATGLGFIVYGFNLDSRFMVWLQRLIGTGIPSTALACLVGAGVICVFMAEQLLRTRRDEATGIKVRALPARSAGRQVAYIVLGVGVFYALGVSSWMVIEYQNVDVRREAAVTLYNRGVALRESAKYAEAITALDEMVHRFGDDPHPAVARLVIQSLENKAFALEQLARNAEAGAVYDDIMTRISDDPDRAMRGSLARTLVAKSLLLVNCGRSPEAIAVCDEAVRRLGADRNPEVRERVAAALHTRGSALSAAGSRTEAISSYSEIVSRFGRDRDLDIRVWVAKALCSQGEELAQLKQSDSALAVYGEVVRRFGDDRESTLKKVVVITRVCMGLMLCELKRSDAAIASFEDAARRFAEDGDPLLAEWAATANYYAAIELYKQGRMDEARVWLCGAWALRAHLEDNFSEWIGDCLKELKLNPDDCEAELTRLQDSLDSIDGDSTGS